MICHTNESNPLTGHRIGPPDNLTAMREFPLTGHRRKRQRDSDSLTENPLTGHRHKHTIIRQESGVNEMVSFRPSRDPIYRSNSTQVVASVQSLDIVESSSTREAPVSETVSIFTERNLMTTGPSPGITSTADDTSVVTSADENLPVAESQVSLFSHRRTPPRRSLSMRSERSSIYAERNMIKSLHDTASTSFDRSPIRSAGVCSRPSSVCTESSTFGLRSRWAFASTDKIPVVTLRGRDQNRFEDEDDDGNGSVESLELLPLESAQLELEQKALAELKLNAKQKDTDKKRKTSVSLTQTKAMIQSFGNRLRKSLRRTKSNLETRSKPEVRNRKLSLNIVEEASSRPTSAPISGDFSPSLYTNVKSGIRPSSTSALNNRCLRDFDKSVSIKSVDRNLVSGPDVPEKPLRLSFLRNSKSSLNASKEAIKNTYVNLLAPVKCLAKDDSRLEDIARSKECTRKSIRHANSNLESVNMKEPVIIRSLSSLETRSRTSCTLDNCPDILESAEAKPSKSNIDISGLTIKRLEDKPSGKGSAVIEAYIPENENLSTFNGLKQCIPDMSPKTPPLLPSYRPPPMSSEPLSVKSGNSSKSSSSSKKRNNSDLSVSSYEDNESQPRVSLPSNLKRRARVTKRPAKKRTNTENLSSGGSENASSSTTTTTTAQIECPYPQKDSDKSPSVNGKNGESGSNNTSDCSTPTASNTPSRESLGTTREKRPKFMKGTDRKGVHKPMPVPPPVPGTLKSEFRQEKDNTSNQSTSNLNTPNGHISTTRSSQSELKSEGKPSPQRPEVTAGSPGSGIPESGSTPTPVRPSVGPKKVWSRPVSNASMVSNSSNDTCINFELLLKEIVNRRTGQMQDSIENSPTIMEATS